MESVNGSLKVECVHDVHFEIESKHDKRSSSNIGYYNTERRHSSLGNIAPAEFERRWPAEIQTEEKHGALVKHRVTHGRPVPGSSRATEPAVRG
jgi:hypothetical protein